LHQKRIDERSASPVKGGERLLAPFSYLRQQALFDATLSGIVRFAGPVSRESQNLVLCKLHASKSFGFSATISAAQGILDAKMWGIVFTDHEAPCLSIPFYSVLFGSASGDVKSAVLGSVNPLKS
jgi:hypothetical protein